MSDHYIFSRGRLKRKHNTIYFESGEEGQKALPVERVDNLHIFGEVDLNSKLLNLLTKYDVRLHFYNYYGFYTGTYYPRTKNVSGFTVVQQSMHYLDPKNGITWHLPLWNPEFITCCAIYAGIKRKPDLMWIPFKRNVLKFLMVGRFPS